MARRGLAGFQMRRSSSHAVHHWLPGSLSQGSRGDAPSGLADSMARDNARREVHLLASMNRWTSRRKRSHSSRAGLVSQPQRVHLQQGPGSQRLGQPMKERRGQAWLRRETPGEASGQSSHEPRGVSHWRTDSARDKPPRCSTTEPENAASKPWSGNGRAEAPPITQRTLRRQVPREGIEVEDSHIRNGQSQRQFLETWSRRRRRGPERDRANSKRQ